MLITLFGHVFKSTSCTHLFSICKNQFHQLGKQQILPLCTHGHEGDHTILTTSKISHGIRQLVTLAFYSIALLVLLIKVDNAMWRHVTEKIVGALPKWILVVSKYLLVQFIN
jgi:hypothetical protein